MTGLRSDLRKRNIAVTGFAVCMRRLSFMRTARFRCRDATRTSFGSHCLISPRFESSTSLFTHSTSHRDDVVRNAEIESVIVGLALLFLRELCAGESGGQFPQLGIREFRGGASFYRSGSVARGRGEISVFHRIFHVGMYDMADFVADDRHQLIVGHQVHQRAEDPDAAVPAGKSVDIYDIVYFEVEGQPVHLDVLGQFFQPCAVFGRLVGNRIVFVHPIHSLFAEPRDIGVGKRDRFHYVAAGLNGFGGIDIPGRRCGFVRKDRYAGPSATALQRTKKYVSSLEIGLADLNKGVYFIRLTQRLQALRTSLFSGSRRMLRTPYIYRESATGNRCRT